MLCKTRIDSTIYHLDCPIVLAHLEWNYFDEAVLSVLHYSYSYHHCIGKIIGTMSKLYDVQKEGLAGKW